MKIDNETLRVLDNCSTSGNILFLPPTQLDRKLYEKVNKVLTCLGGKWNRGAKGHVFETDPADMIDEAILTGEVTDAKKEFQFFETPKEIASQMIALADIKKDDDVGEPSAGQGAIADLIYGYNSLTVIELNPDNVKVLISKGYNVITADFLTCYTSVAEAKGIFSKIVMNPPFSRQQDIDHVTHAWNLLRDGGRLVSIMCE
jgi:hypothetical protein